jgi:hypothetical protein
MPQLSTNVDQCHTVRLPSGMRDELVAATGQPFSTIVRYMCMELVKRRRAERQAAATTNPKPALREQIAEIPDSKGHTL